MRGILLIAQRQVIGYLRPEFIQSAFWAARRKSGMPATKEQTYLLYRYGFTDGIEHPLIGAALHFHLSESRTKKVEGEAMGSLRGKLAWWF